jgi:hypothetical protein
MSSIYKELWSIQNSDDAEQIVSLLKKIS